MYNSYFNQQHAGKQIHQNLHLNMYNPMVQSFGYTASYSENAHYNVYPSHLICDNTTVNDGRITARQEDKRVIEQFLQETDSEIYMWSKQKDPFKIATFKSALVSVAKLNKEFKAVLVDLRNSIDVPEMQWREKIDAYNVAKHEISQILQSINNPEYLCKVKKDLAKREKKRLRERHRKRKWKEETVIRMEQRAKLHAKIDSWIRKEQSVIEQEKQEENLRKDADMILSDVRSKKSDARKYLGILQELQNLRKIKANIARARGEHLSSAADEAFNDIIAKLTEQWSILDREYSIEEQGLKLMLETNNEKRIVKQTKNSFDEWENVLFGRSISAAEQCQKNLNSFIMTRMAWDKFISSEDDATTIPIGWVVPEKPSSAAWQKCLVKENSSDK